MRRRCSLIIILFCLIPVGLSRVLYAGVADQVVSGMAQLTATATDNVGVVGVQFKVDGNNYGAELTSSPYVATWNSATVANGTHTLSVTARDAAGNQTTASASVTVNNVVDTAPPSAPGGLLTVATSGTQINLSWTAATDNVAVTGYLIERCQGSGCTTFSQIATTTGTATSYSDTGRTSATLYRYRIRATDAASNLSSYSAIANATTLTIDTTAPLISAVTMSNPTSNSITVNWTTNEAADSVIEYGLTTAYGSSTVLDTTLVTSHSKTLSGLAAGTAYNFRVKSSDAAGNLAVSSNFTFTTVGGSSQSLVTYLKMDETGGTVALDSSGNGLSGTAVNGPTFVGGEYGNAVKLNGTTQYLDLGNSAALQLTGSMTIAAWINSSAFPSGDAAIVSRLNAGFTGFELDTTVDRGPRTIGFKLATPTGPLMARYGATTLQTNTWYHVAGVYDSAARTLTVYLNGQLDNGPLSGTVAGSQLTSGGNLNIGRRPSASGFEFSGAIDEVQLYSRALTQAEIQAVISNSPTVPLSNLDQGRPGDFDGDGKTDFAIYRPSTGDWFLQLSSLAFGGGAGNYQWGLPGDVPISGDFDGDRKMDIAISRPSTGEWFLRLSVQKYAIGGGNWYFQWGMSGDIPMASDFDGDGKTDIAVYRPSSGEWFLRLSTRNYAMASGNWYFQWGLRGDQPVAGDFDGDGKTDIAVYRPSSGEWFLRLSTQNYVIGGGNWYFQWGISGDIPLAADFDGDGKTDIAVYRPTSGEWFLRLSSRNFAMASGNWYFQWGMSGDQPVVGDFDGDGKADIGVYRPSTKEWFLRLSSQGYAVASGNWYFRSTVPGNIP